MKKLLLASAMTAITASGALVSTTTAALADAHSGPVKIGVVLGFTGPLETITPAMGAAAEMAIKEVSDAGTLLGGKTVEPVRADSTCIDAGAATAAAERLITSDGVAAIMGADCSGVTGAVLANVAVPNGVVMISPSATSPGLSSAEDNGLFFRTAPSDARQGEVLANMLIERDIRSVALTYTNNDYGKGLADSFQSAYEAAGGSVTISAAHEDGKADYSAEVGALASGGGDVLVVAGYVDQGGKGVIQAALDAGAFDTFVLPDGMYGQSLIDAIGSDLDGTFGLVPGSESDGVETFKTLADEAGLDGTSSYTAESYDAAALILLSMAAAGSSDSNVFKDKVMEVANAPGEKINPGELARAIEILQSGGDIDYVGASSVELIGPGESAGAFREYEIKDGAVETLTFR